MVAGTAMSVVRVIMHVFSIHIYDDATMWVQKPADEKKEFSTEFLAKLEKNQGPKGRNVHLPVLNNAETMYVLCRCSH